MKTTTACIAAIAVSAALGLTACGGDARATDPKVTAPATPLASKAPSHATTSTTPPAACPARAAEEPAAIALVRTYVAEYNKALQSGSTTAFGETFDKSCAMCLAEATTIDGTFRRKQRLRGLRYAVASTLVVFSGIAHGGHQIWVQGQLSQAGGQILAAAGTVIQRITPTPGFRVTWRVGPGSTPVIVESFQ